MWDTRAREDRNTAYILQSEWPLQSTTFNIEHKDGKGNLLSPIEVQFALVTHKESLEGLNIYDELANEIGLDVESKARELIDDKSLDDTRLLIQKMSEPDESYMAM